MEHRGRRASALEVRVTGARRHLAHEERAGHDIRRDIHTRHGTKRYDPIRYPTIRYGARSYDTIRYDTIRNDTLRYDTERYADLVIRGGPPGTGHRKRLEPRPGVVPREGDTTRYGALRYTITRRGNGTDTRRHETKRGFVGLVKRRHTAT